MPFSGFWRRFAAALVDWAVLSFLQWPVVVATFLPLVVGVAASVSSPEEVGVVALFSYLAAILAGVAVNVAYSVLLIGWRGQTLGMMALGIKVVRTDGSPVNYRVALVRWLGSILSGLALYLGYLWIAFHPRKQAWHDTLADTCVINLGAASQATRPPAAQWPASST